LTTIAARRLGVRWMHAEFRNGTVMYVKLLCLKAWIVTGWNTRSIRDTHGTLASVGG